MRVLFVCTANICRSPMAAALFAKAAHDYGADGAVAASAGFLEGGRPAHDSVMEILGQKGIDLSRKRSRKLSADLVDGADLILTMTSEHARGVVSRFPSSIDKVYTLRHFAVVVSPRDLDQTPEAWLEVISASTRRSYVSDDEAGDVPDPIGREFSVFTALGVELENSINWIMGCAYPKQPNMVLD
jgi:protein-tyrosine phosphatase